MRDPYNCPQSGDLFVSRSGKLQRVVLGRYFDNLEIEVVRFSVTRLDREPSEPRTWNFTTGIRVWINDIRYFNYIYGRKSKEKTTNQIWAEAF